MKLSKTQIKVLRAAAENGGEWAPCDIKWFGRCARGLEARGLVRIIEGGRYRTVRGIKLNQEAYDALADAEAAK
jgi:hypothetical protein